LKDLGENMPDNFFLIIRDKESGERLGAIFKNVKTKMTYNGFKHFPLDLTNDEVADLITQSPLGMAIVCDVQTADQLSKSSLAWLEQNGRKLIGRPTGGIIEIFTPLNNISPKRPNT
jgi:hypothetical protein